MSYPEHEKLKKVVDKSQTVGEFMEWLGEKGYFLAEYVGDKDFPNAVRTRKEDLLAEFFGIDQKKLEAEKRAMLDSIRTENKKQRRA